MVLLGDPVVFMDCETLGLDADVHPIWEWAMIIGEQEYSWQLKLTGRAISLADPEALRISRFAERYDPEAAMPADEVCSRVRQLTLGLHPVGAVVSFDEERMRRLMWRSEVTPTWHYHLIDVEALAAGCLAERGRWLAAGPGTLPEQAAILRTHSRPPWQSRELSQLLGVDPDAFEAHTALGDARWARALYEAVVAGPPPAAAPAAASTA